MYDGTDAAEMFRLYDAGNQKDFPMLQAGVLVIGAVYLVSTLIADLLTPLLNPRLRLQGVR